MQTSAAVLDRPAIAPSGPASKQLVPDALIVPEEYLNALDFGTSAEFFLKLQPEKAKPNLSEICPLIPN